MGSAGLANRQDERLLLRVECECGIGPLGPGDGQGQQGRSQASTNRDCRVEQGGRAVEAKGLDPALAERRVEERRRSKEKGSAFPSLEGPDFFFRPQAQVSWGSVAAR